MESFSISSEAVTALVALLGAAVGAALGAFLAHRYSRKRDHLEMKRDVLRRLMGHRWHLTLGNGPPESPVFTALNEIPIVFAGHKEVEEAFGTFRQSVNQGRFRAEGLVPLVIAMARAAEVPHKGWTAELITTPSAPGPQYNRSSS